MTPAIAMARPRVTLAIPFPPLAALFPEAEGLAVPELVVLAVALGSELPVMSNCLPIAGIAGLPLMGHPLAVDEGHAGVERLAADLV